MVSDEVVYHDGNHNMVPRFVHYRGMDWMVFRSGSGHRSYDGRIRIIRSPDMKNWSKPRTVIDTPFDDRDPSIFVCGGRLFVVSLSVERTFLDDARPFRGLKSQGSCRCFISYTMDGEKWSSPKQVLPNNYVIWWPIISGNLVYAAVQRRVPDWIDLNELVKSLPAGNMKGLRRPLEFVNRVDRQAELWASRNGLEWSQVSVICDQDQASETALTILPDSRMVGFVRHDDHESGPSKGCRPEVVVSSPPYTSWKRVYRFDFKTNGPCMGCVGDMLITCSRAFFEDERTPLNTDLCRERVRGLIIGILDIVGEDWMPEIVIPHHRGPRTNGDRASDPSLNFPDLSYAWMRDEGNGDFFLSYYEGYKGKPSDIRIARIRSR